MAWLDQREAARRSRAAGHAAIPPSLQWNFSPQDVTDLQGSLVGHATIPSDADYPTARQIFSRAFELFPQILVTCEVPADIGFAVEFARKFDLPITCRSGGHSTAGFSMNDGMVIDVSRLDSISIDKSGTRLTIGAGALFGHVNSTMDSYEVHLPGGSCEGVGLGGYVQGGGYGYTSLIYGMNIDRVISAWVFTAEQGLVHCDETENPDLFWAIRGGGACGSFGVLVEVTYRYVEMGDVTAFALQWPLDQAGEVMALMQSSFAGEAVPKGLGYQNTAGFVNGERVLLSLGLFRGNAGECLAALDPLLKTGSPDLAISPAPLPYNAAMGFLDNQFPPGIPNVAIHTPTIADSRYVTANIGVDGWSTIMNLIESAPDQVTFFGLEPYGGAITERKKDATAFVHREAGFDVYVWVFFTNDEQRKNAEDFLELFRNTMKTLGNGRAYQNYPARDNDEYLKMYYGSNLKRLMDIKQQWDPHDVFSYGQTIPLPKAGV